MSNPDIAIVTAIYDDYDTLKPVLRQVGADVEWILVTDSMIDSNEPYDHPRWSYNTIFAPKPGVHPNRAAKFPKMKPHDFTTAQKSIWIDASFRVVSENFARDILDILEICDIAQFKHPWRDCIYDEAEESLRLEKYRDVYDHIKFQMDSYRVQNHPKNWGLWATGVIARNHTKKNQDIGIDWLNDNIRYSYQDQLSEAFHLRRQRTKPFEFFGTHFANPWLRYEGSGRH